MRTLSYWEDALGEALCEHTSLYDQFTSEQRTAIAEDLMLCASVESQYSGSENIPNPQIAEIERLKKELKKEMSKRHCQECGGTGRTQEAVGSSHVAHSQCYKCNGEGKC